MSADDATLATPGWRTRLRSWADPELLPLCGFLLLPLLVSSGPRVGFYFNLAIELLIATKLSEEAF